MRTARVLLSDAVNQAGSAHDEVCTAPPLLDNDHKKCMHLETLEFKEVIFALVVYFPL